MQLIKQDNIIIPDIVSALKQGQTIVYPTETCYGLGCDATNEQAVNKIFEIKRRQRKKPLLVVVSEPFVIMNYTSWNKTLQQLSEKYWPGALTVVVPVSDKVCLPPGVVGEDGTLAFRITAHPLASQLSHGLGKPIVSTSANITTLGSPYDIESVLDMFVNAEFRPDIIIDAGSLPHRSPSTVVRVVNGDIEVLRQGETVVEL